MYKKGRFVEASILHGPTCPRRSKLGDWIGKLHGLCTALDGELKPHAERILVPCNIVLVPFGCPPSHHHHQNIATFLSIAVEAKVKCKTESRVGNDNTRGGAIWEGGLGLSTSIYLVSSSSE